MIRVDSQWDDLNSDEFRDFLQFEVYEEIGLEFGEVLPDDDDPTEWPMLDLEVGCRWWEV